MPWGAIGVTAICALERSVAAFRLRQFLAASGTPSGRRDERLTVSELSSTIQCAAVVQSAVATASTERVKPSNLPRADSRPSRFEAEELTLNGSPGLSVLPAVGGHRRLERSAVLPLGRSIAEPTV